MATVFELAPISPRRHPARRFTQLVVGLVLYGVSMAALVRARLGLDPWDVLHQGLAGRLGVSFGTVTAIVGVAVLLAWIPLRQRPGIGTVANVVIIAVSVDAGLGVIPEPGSAGGRIALMLAGVLVNGLAGACYVGARLGPGPRDGLMTGVHARAGWSVRVVRTGIELSVLAVGWLLGGTVGVGTVVYALAIGPLVQLMLPWLAYRPERRAPAPVEAAPCGAAPTIPPPAG